MIATHEAAATNNIIDALEQVAQYGTPPAGLAQLLDVGSQPFLQYFEREVLRELVLAGGATCKFIEGAYGSGKSHLLDLLHGAAATKGMAVVRTDLQQALGLDDWRLITRHLLERLEVLVSGNVYRSLPQVLEALSSEARADTAALGRAGLPHAGFARAMTLLAGNYDLSEAGRDLLRQYLLGEPVTARELRFHRIDGVKSPLSVRNAEQVLRTVLKGLHSLGIPGTLLLFDENEKTFVFAGRRVPDRVVRGANLMRRIIDGCASDALVATAAVFFVLPNFVQTCTLAYEALGQRLQNPPRLGRSGAWRWPLLSIEDITPTLSPADFMIRAAGRLRQLLEECGEPADGAEARMIAAGRLILERHAGSGYRRPLMKNLATLALLEMDHQ